MSVCIDHYHSDTVLTPNSGFLDPRPWILDPDNLLELTSFPCYNYCLCKEVPMKRLTAAAILFVLSAGLIFSAEVSERKDVGVLPVYSSYNIPDAAYRYFDDMLISTLSSMQRFRVVGYQYRLDNNSAEDFIRKIQELKKQALNEDPRYMDADLGIVVIPASEMKKLVNSFFVFVPSITGYSTTEYDVEVKVKKGKEVQIRIEREYKASVTISVKIITAEGNLMKTYTASSETTSRRSAIDAYQKGVNTSISGVSYFLRNVEEFKIKSQVLKVEGNQVWMELGGNLGIYPGYEFALQSQVKVLDRFTEKVDTGLVRVNAVGQQYSTATVIIGYPRVGDQLVESPMGGARFNIYVGAFPMMIDQARIITERIGTVVTNRYTINPSTYVADLGLRFEGEIGFGGLLNFNAGILFGDPFGYYFDLGGGYEIYLGSMSLTLGGDLSVLGLYKYLRTFSYPFDFTINDSGAVFESYSNVDVSLVGFTFGIKPKLTYNIQFGQRFKLRLTGGYAFYFAPMYQFSYNQGSGDDKVSASVDVNSQLPINFNGPYGGLELVFRF